jgi:hypothetical protein
MGALGAGVEQERVRKNVRPAEGEPFRVDLDGGGVRIRREPATTGRVEPPASGGRGHAS